MQDKLSYLLSSRKFWATVLVLILALAGPSAGLSDEAITKIALTVSAYILGTALEDGLSRRLPSSPAQPPVVSNAEPRDLAVRPPASRPKGLSPYTRQ